MTKSSKSLLEVRLLRSSIVSAKFGNQEFALRVTGVAFGDETRSFCSFFCLVRASSLISFDLCLESIDDKRSKRLTEHMDRKVEDDSATLSSSFGIWIFRCEMAVFIFYIECLRSMSFRWSCTPLFASAILKLPLYSKFVSRILLFSHSLKKSKWLVTLASFASCVRMVLNVFFSVSDRYLNSLNLPGR